MEYSIGARRSWLILAASAMVGAIILITGALSPITISADDGKNDEVQQNDPQAVIEALEASVELLPNNEGIRITWNPLTHANHPIISLPGRGAVLPVMFHVERSAMVDGVYGDYELVGGFPNTTAFHRLKVVDTDIEDGTTYQYRILILYRDEFTLVSWALGPVTTASEKSNEEPAQQEQVEDSGSDEPVLDPTDPNLLLERLEPEIALLPNDEGIRIRWNVLHDANHYSSASPYGDATLPTSFTVERRTLEGDVYSGYTALGSVPNDVAAGPFAGRLEYVDRDLTEGQTYQYRLIVVYPDNITLADNPLDPITTAPDVVDKAPVQQTPEAPAEVESEVESENEEEKEDVQEEEVPEEELPEIDHSDPNLLLARLEEEITLILNDNSVRIVWNALHDANHYSSASPYGDATLPLSFNIERSVLEGSEYSAYAVMGNVANTVGRLEFTDTTIARDQTYQYRLVIIYPDDITLAGHPMGPIFTGEEEKVVEEPEAEPVDPNLNIDALDADITLLPNNEGIRVHWNALDATNHVGTASPHDDAEALPESFYIERRELRDDGYTGYFFMGEVANTVGRLEFIDWPLLDDKTYQYRVVIMYPDGVTLAGNPMGPIFTGGEEDDDANGGEVEQSDVAPTPEEQSPEQQDSPEEHKAASSAEFDLSLFASVVAPEADLLPNGRGIRVRWNALTSANHAGIAPPEAGGKLPVVFRVERRTVDESGDGEFAMIGSVQNDPFGEKLRFIDAKVVPQETYQYRLSVFYTTAAGNFDVPLEPVGSGVKFELVDLQLGQEAFQVNSGVRVRWTPAANDWGQTHYRVERRTEGVGSSWTVISANVTQDNPNAKRMRITDADVTAGTTYTYRITLRDSEDKLIGTAMNVSLTVSQ